MGMQAKRMVPNSWLRLILTRRGRRKRIRESDMRHCLNINSSINKFEV